jgi:hypothetical protein
MSDSFDDDPAEEIAQLEDIVMAHNEELAQLQARVKELETFVSFAVLHSSDPVLMKLANELLAKGI